MLDQPPQYPGEELQDTLSYQSSLSYDSHTSLHSQSSSSHKRACVVTMNQNMPSQKWDTKLKTNDPEHDKTSPNNIAWENRNCHSPTEHSHSNEGSKGSSKSTDSSHSGINGFVNGQVPRYITPPKC